MLHHDAIQQHDAHEHEGCEDGYGGDTAEPGEGLDAAEGGFGKPEEENVPGVGIPDRYRSVSKIKDFFFA